MQLIRGVRNLKNFQRLLNLKAVDAEQVSSPEMVLTIGAFDGLHHGHQAVLKHVTEMAAKRQAKSMVLTLDPLPREFFLPLSAPPRLMSFREKFEGLQMLGIDYLLVIKFDDALRNVEAADFIKQVFVDSLSVNHVVIGDDFRFGRDGKGDFELLQRLGLKHGFSVESTQTKILDGERVSSTRIRDLLGEADFALAEKLLGRPYSISGKVVYGQQLASKLEVPTANVELHRLRAAMSGVYATEVQVEGQGLWLPAVANVGTRPTINESIKAILEVHILDYKQHLYGKQITVRFRHKIRNEKKFASIDELKKNIHQDIDVAKVWFASN